MTQNPMMIHQLRNLILMDNGVLGSIRQRISTILKSDLKPNEFEVKDVSY